MHSKPISIKPLPASTEGPFCAPCREKKSTAKDISDGEAEGRCSQKWGIC